MDTMVDIAMPIDIQGELTQTPQSTPQDTLAMATTKIEGMDGGRIRGGGGRRGAAGKAGKVGKRRRGEEEEEEEEGEWGEEVKSTTKKARGRPRGKAIGGDSKKKGKGGKKEETKDEEPPLVERPRGKRGEGRRSYVEEDEPPLTKEDLIYINNGVPPPPGLELVEIKEGREEKIKAGSLVYAREVELKRGVKRNREWEWEGRGRGRGENRHLSKLVRGLKLRGGAGKFISRASS